MNWYSGLKDGEDESVLDIHKRCQNKVLVWLKPAPKDVNRISYKVVDSGTELVLIPPGSSFLNKVPDSDAGSHFKFDKIYEPGTSAEVISDYCKQDVMDALFQGYNVSFMAYGAKCTGKMSSMFGTQGIISALCADVFDKIGQGLQKGYMDYTVSISCFELYAERAYDLLSELQDIKHLKIHTNSKTHKVHLERLQFITIEDEKELNYYLEKAKSKQNKIRAGLTTRSTIVMDLIIQQRNKRDQHVLQSVLRMVKLASSDKVEKNSALGISVEDAKKINMSIECLNNVSAALAKIQDNAGKQVKTKLDMVPYKNSYLTRILKSSFGGETKNIILLTSSSAHEHIKDTISTLKFGLMSKKVTNSLVMNKKALNDKRQLELLLEDMKLKEENHQTKIKLLEDRLEAGANIKLDKNTALDGKEHDLADENKKLQLQLDSLSQLLKHTYTQSLPQQHTTLQNKVNENEHSELMEKLIEKCEQVAETQLDLDTKKQQLYTFSMHNTQLIGENETLKQLNTKLTDRLNDMEAQFRDILSENAILIEQVNKLTGLAGARAERIKEYDVAVSTSGINTGLPLPKVRSYFAKDNLAEPSIGFKSSWFKRNASTGSWNTRKVSNTSTTTLDSQDLMKNSAKGINLHVLKFTDDKN